MITTILFDLSEVYLQGMKGIEGRINTLHGTNIPSGAFKKLPVTSAFFHGEVSEETFWDNIIQDHNIGCTVPELIHLVRVNFKEIEGTRAIIKKLRKNGYKLGLLSVHSREWVDYCEGLFDFHKLFHSRLYSFEVAVSKPEKRAYELILEKIGSQAHECLFIDDMETNLVPARKLGMKTLLFVDANTLEKELRKLTINL